MTFTFRAMQIVLVAAAVAGCMETNPKEPTTQPLASAGVRTMTPVDPSLTHRYSFNGDAKDSVGKIDGVLKGSAKISGGKVVLDGDALKSDAANLPYLEFGSPLLPPAGSASIALWFTASEKTDTYAPRLLDIGDRSGNVGDAFIYFAPHFTTTQNARTKISAADSGSGTPVDGPRLDDGKPHVVVIAVDATMIHVFVDGKEPVAGASIGGNTLASVRQVHSWIGRSGFDQDGGINASIDEVRTYNRALTLADAAALVAAGPDKVPAR